MADIFVSYAGEDRERVAPLVERLEQHGWSVWWARRLHPGPEFEDEIERELDAAKCVVVVWSELSVASRWVKTEANEAMERGILVPILIDRVKPPLAFRRLQTAEAIDWDADGEGVQSLIQGVHLLLRADDNIGDFVGRRSELAQILGHAEQARSNQGCLVIIDGEPGIGKTRLINEFERRLDRESCKVLWGYSHEELAAPPLFAWTSVLRAAISQCPEAITNAMIDPWQKELAILVPEVAPDLTLQTSTSEDYQRVQLFTAVSQFLFSVSRKLPLVVVFDNLHLMDRTSIRLLDFLCEQMNNQSILVVCAYRSTDVDRNHPLFHSLGKLTGSPLCRRISLTGLTPADVENLSDLLGEEALDHDVEQKLYLQSNGNPLYVRELIQFAKTNPEGSRVPERIREIISERLHRLPSEVDEVLGIAAVIGREFELRLLDPLLEKRSRNQILRALDIAVSQKLVDGTTVPGVYCFHHDLIRSTLYAEHGTAKRTLIHRHIAQLLVSGSFDTPIANVAFHHYEAAQGGDVDAAVRYASEAGDAASRLYAFDEAADHYNKGLQLLQLANRLDVNLHIKLLIRKGEVEDAAGQIDAANKSLLSACLTASRHALWTLLAEAVIAFQVLRRKIGVTHQVLIPLHKNALEHCDQQADELRTNLLASLAISEIKELDIGNARVHAEESLAIARQLGDKLSLFHALEAMGSVYYYLTPDMDDTLPVLEEGVRLAEELDRPMHKMEALNNIAGYYNRTGNVEQLLPLWHQFRELAELTQYFHFRYLAEGGLAGTAILQGRWDEATAHAKRQQELGREMGAEGVDGVFAYQMFTMEWARGNLGFIRPMIQHLSATGDAGFWDPALAILGAELDLPELVTSAFERMSNKGLRQFADVGDRPLILCWLAEACVYMNNGEHAEVLYELMYPYRDVMAGVESASSIGAYARHIAKLAFLLGRIDEAHALFRRAIDLNTRAGAAPWLAFTQYDYAILLLSGAKRENRDATLALLHDARGAAKKYRLKKLLADTHRVLAMLDEGAERLSTREMDVLGLVESGASNREIADKLFVSQSTVATHLRNILRKTEAANRVEAVANARKAGWLLHSR